MKLVFRREEGTTRFVISKFKNGTVVAVTEIMIALIFFLVILAVLSLTKPFSATMFISAVAATTVMFIIDSRYRSSKTWKREE